MKAVHVAHNLYGLPFNSILKQLAFKPGIPGLKWDSAARLYLGGPDAIAVAAGMLRGHKISVELPQLATPALDDFQLPVADSKLRDYQREAVAFLLSQKRCLLADDMGLGKSCSAITAARAVNSRTLIVVPSFVRGVWWSDRPIPIPELKLWWPKVFPDVVRPEGIKSPRPIEGQVCLIHYDILPAWADFIASWNPRVVIFDECHALMSEGSKRSVAARQVSASAEFVWGLSGTPMTSRPKDLWNAVDTICPGRFGNFFAYGLRYCDAHKENVTPTKAVWKFNGSSNESELAARLKYLMIRRTRSEVAIQLPAKTRQMISLEVPRRPLPKNLTQTALRRHLEVAADAKMSQVEELVLEHLSGGKKLVVFTYRRVIAEMLANAAAGAGFKSAVIHGGVAMMRRQKAIDSVAAAPVGLLAATIDTAGTGINLSFAYTVIFAETTWEPHEMLQAEARCGRDIGGEPVLVQYPIASGTIDEIVVGKLLSKLATRDKAIGRHDDGLAASLSGDEDDVFAAIARDLEKAG